MKSQRNVTDVAKLMILVLSSIPGSSFETIAKTHHGNDGQNQLIRELGLKNIPNISKANISTGEYTRMLSIYEESVRQAEEMKRLRRKFKSIPHSVPAKQETNLSQMRYKISDQPHIQSKAILQFPTPQFLPHFALTLVLSATLTINMKRRRALSSTFRQVVASQLLDEDEGVTIDTVDIDDEDHVTLELDFTDAVQS